MVGRRSNKKSLVSRENSYFNKYKFDSIKTSLATTCPANPLKGFQQCREDLHNFMLRVAFVCVCYIILSHKFNWVNNNYTPKWTDYSCWPNSRFFFLQISRRTEKIQVKPSSISFYAPRTNSVHSLCYDKKQQWNNRVHYLHFIIFSVLLLCTVNILLWLNTAKKSTPLLMFTHTRMWKNLCVGVDLVKADNDQYVCVIVYTRR